MHVLDASFTHVTRRNVTAEKVEDQGYPMAQM